MHFVTRERIHVDRIATAWAIRRFIDPDGNSLGIEHIALALLTSASSVRTCDLDNSNSSRQKESGKAGSVRARPLDSNSL